LTIHASSDELRRSTKRDGWPASGVFSNLNHFELAEMLGIESSPLSDLLIEKIRLAVR